MKWKKPKKIFHYFFGIFIIFALFLFVSPTHAAAPPAVISYQGKLLVGGASATTSYQMGFLIYDAATNGNILYTASGTISTTSTISVTPTQGIFSVDFGGAGTNTLSPALFGNNASLYLEVWIGGQKLSPRKQLTATPFALNANYLMGIGVATASTTTYIPSSDANGNFAFTGTPQNTGVSGGVLYINPASATANYSLLGVSVNNAERFRLDAEGDSWFLGNMSVTGTLRTGGTVTFPDIIASNSITLGGESRTTWPTSTSSGGSSSGPWTTSTGRTYLSPTSTVMVLGATTTSTTGTIFEVNGNTLFQNGTTTFRGLAAIDGIIRTPRVIGTTGSSLPNTETGIDTQGDYAYITAFEGSMSVVNISNPALPRFIAKISNGDGGAHMVNPVSIHVRGDYAYITDNNFSDAGLEIIDISNPWMPRHVAFFDRDSAGATLNYASGLAIAGNVAFLGQWADMILINIADPKNPRYMSHVSFASGQADHITVSGKMVYVGTSWRDFEVIDISDPYRPQVMSSISTATNSSISGIATQGENVYLSASGGSGGLYIINVASSSAPVVSGSIINGSGGAALSSATGVNVSGRYAYIPAATGGGGSVAVLEIIDISSSTLPTHVGYATLSTPNSVPFGVSLQGNNAYVISDTLDVVDISGARISNADIGTLRAGILNIQDNAMFNANMYIHGALSVGKSGLIDNGDFSILSASSSDSIAATNTLHFSHTTLFETMATGTDDMAFQFRTANTWTSSSAKYLLSVRNGNNKLMSLATDGSLRVAGALFASSTSIGTPGTPGDLAERVDIAPTDTVEPGDVLVVDQAGVDRYTKSNTAYATGIAGVVSTQPTIVLGSGITEHNASLAMIGRVPVKVSTEHGAITTGDLLVSAATPGYAMKYVASDAPTNARPGIIGIALDSFAGDESSYGKIMVLLRVETAGSINNNSNTTNLTVVQSSNGQLQTIGNSDLNIGGFALLNVQKINSTNNQWEIDSTGYLVRHVQTAQGVVNLYATQSEDMTIVLSGTTTLQNGAAQVTFPSSTQTLIDENAPIVVTVTPENQSTVLYVTDKTAHGFTIHSSNSSDTATCNWIAIVREKNNMPDPTPTTVTPPETPDTTQNTDQSTTPPDEVAPPDTPTSTDQSSPPIDTPPASTTPEEITPPTSTAEQVATSTSI